MEPGLPTSSSMFRNELHKMSNSWLKPRRSVISSCVPNITCTFGCLSTSHLSCQRLCGDLWSHYLPPSARSKHPAPALQGETVADYAQSLCPSLRRERCEKARKLHEHQFLSLVVGMGFHSSPRDRRRLTVIPGMMTGGGCSSDKLSQLPKVT